MCWSLLAAAAIAAPAVAKPESEAESTHDRWVSMRDLVALPALVRPLDAPVELEIGPETLALEGGWVVPVFSGRLEGEWEDHGERWLRGEDEPRVPDAGERGVQALVGFVWSGGTGRVTVDLSDRADGQILANRMVLEVGEDASAWAPVAHGDAPLQAGVTDAIVLGTSSAISAAFRGREDVDPYEVVVYADSDGARRAARRAVGLLRERSAVWEGVDHDPGGRIAWDRLAIERKVVGAEGTYTRWELLTDRRYGLVAPEVGGDADRWLAVTRDLTGETDQRREVRVSSPGLPPSGGAVDGLVGGVPHPPADRSDPSSAPLPRRRVEPVEADSTIAVQPSRSGLDLEVRVDSRLTVRAQGGPAAWLDLTFPKMDRRPGSFRVVVAELDDGTPLIGREAQDVAAPTPEPEPDPEPRPEPPPEPGEAHVRLLLPTPLAMGESVTVHVVHEDTWPYAVFSTEGTVALGQSSGLQGFLPAVLPYRIGAPWTFRVKVGVPAASPLVVAVSGRTVDETDEGGWRAVRAESEGRRGYWPAVAVGRYVVADEPAQLGFPAVRARAFSTHYGTIEQFGPETRRVVQFYQGYLPPFPVAEVEVFEAPAAFDAFRWVAPHGMVNLQLMMSTAQVGATPTEPHFESAVYAHELAHQYWGHLAPPANGEDFWIAESFSELFACMYVSAAFDARACEVRMKHNRQAWEAAGASERPATLSGAYASAAQPAIVYDYGPYVLGEMLIRRIGREAFFSAIDVMLREHPHEPLTSERLRGYLEAASGRDLGPFFDFWVHGGRLPELELTWSAKGRRVSGTVRADVPFGTFDVPVVLRSKEAELPVFVTVTDGTGTFEAEAPGSKPEVLLDPDGFVLARKRAVRKP